MHLKKNVYKFLFLCVSFAELVAQQLPPSYSVTVYDSSAASGYYFLTPGKIGFSSIKPHHYILDKKGRLVYFKKFNSSTSDFKLHPNKLMSYQYSGKEYIMDSTFTVIDSVSIKNGLLFDAHDFLMLPNGHYTLLGNEKIPMNLSSYYMFGANNTAPGSTNAMVTCGVIQELDAAKNVVFEWHSKNYYSFADVDEKFLGSPNNVDWTHYNAVEMDQDGNYLVSSRHFCEITKINRNDSSIIWRLGGKQNQFNFINDPNKFIGQHNIRRLPNGNVGLFDNGYNTTPLHPAAAKEYKLNETAKTATLTWSYTENNSAYSTFIGNSQHLQNGNILVDWGGITNNITTLFNVVTPAGNKVFEVVFTDTLRSYRVFNYNLPWSFNRPTVTCNYNGSQYYLDAGSGHASYLWSTGATSQTIAITAPGNYYVFVPYGSGGYVSSEWYQVGNVSNPCVISSVADLSDEQWNLYPNPFSNKITVEIPGLYHGSLEIFDITGSEVFSVSIPAGQSKIDLDTGDFSQGIYFMKCGNSVRKLMKQ